MRISMISILYLRRLPNHPAGRGAFFFVSVGRGQSRALAVGSIGTRAQRGVAMMWEGSGREGCWKEGGKGWKGRRWAARAGGG